MGFCFRVNEVVHDGSDLLCGVDGRWNVSRTLCLYKIAGGFQADARMSRLQVQPVQSLDGTLELFMTHDGTDVKLNLGLMFL
jgi:hypothetical protein